ncbi:MAG TPA: pentapeptide repeat-containing protein, partial [Gammaproteobacteria bacterium]|nr:pentapeptide repeat-containing protein [Gammaproteobacteria bacterium]
MSERTTLARLAALCLALAPLPVALAFSETDLATLEETGSCSGCDLAGADLYEADLFQADLSLSDLSGADLTAADLTLANLRSVDLRGAILDETNLSGANLAKAILDKDALAGAIFDSERTRTTLGFKDLKLGMNAVEVAQYCSIETVHGKTVYLGTPLGSTIKQLDGTCFDNADMPFTFKFSGGGTTGVLNFLQVGLAPYTEKGHRKFIDLLAKKYDPAYSYSAQDVAAFNNNRDLDIKRLNTIFANGQVTLSIVGEGAGLQMLLSYRDIEHGRRFLKLKGDLAPVDLTHLPPITADLYKLVGNYKLKGIGAKGTNTNHGRIDTAYLEIDAFENELAGELVISGHGMSGRFRIIGIEKISGNRLTVQLEPVTGTIPDGRPLRMSLEFSEDGDSFTGKWTNWFRLKNTKSRRPDDFKGSRSQSFWQTAMSHNRIDMYQAYLRLRPGGIYSAVARSRITELGGTLVAPSAPTVATAVTAAPSTSVTPATATATTTPVDPLVGVWHWQGGFFGFADNCYLAVGINDQGVLVGKSWETHQQTHLINFFEAEEIIGFNIVGVRDITIGQMNIGAYTWKTEETLQSAENWTKGGLTGKLYLNMKDQNVESLDVNNRICRKTRSESKNSRFKKLPLEEALALELPPELLEGFPSPFATEGPQVVSVPKASASASAVPSTPTTTTTPVDPLVGVWQQTDVRYEDCQLVVGQDSRGQLMGISFSTVSRNKLIGNDGPRYPKGTVDWSPSNPSQGFVARKLTIEQGPGGTYTWTSEISFKGNLWEAPT